MMCSQRFVLSFSVALALVGVVQHPEGLGLADESVRLRYFADGTGETSMNPGAEMGIALLAIGALSVTTVIAGPGSTAST